MQAFGKFTCKKKLVYRTEAYLYINAKDKVLSLEEFEEMIEEKHNFIAGTIMLFHPGNSVPKGLDANKSLIDQAYDFTQGYTELNLDKMLLAFDGLLKAYEGKFIEIKTLFNYNEANLQRRNALSKFNIDLEGSKIHFDNDNYNFSKKIIFDGNFVFFAWGDKFTKETFPNINAYAHGILKAAMTQVTNIAFTYDPAQSIQEATELLHFGHPLSVGEIKNKVPKAIKKAFKTNPPLSIAW